MTAARVEQIEARLQRALDPREVLVLDESQHHVGHAGARDGKGHFRVKIVSQCFDGLSSIARHRLVFAALQDMMATDIHALSIEAASPAENSPL